MYNPITGGESRDTSDGAGGTINIDSLLPGGIYYTNKNIEECYDDMKKIDRDISNLFNNLEKVGPEKQIHQADPSGDSTYTGIYNYFPSDSTISVECYDWSNKITKEKNWVDNLRISISSKEFNDWLWQ